MERKAKHEERIEAIKDEYDAWRAARGKIVA